MIYFLIKQLGDEISKLVLCQEKNENEIEIENKIESGIQREMHSAAVKEEEAVTMRKEQDDIIEKGIEKKKSERKEERKEKNKEKNKDRDNDPMEIMNIVSQQEEIDTETENENENDTEEEKSFIFQNEFGTSIDQNDENGNNEESLFLSGKLPILFNLPVLTSSKDKFLGDNIPTEHSLDLLEHSFTSTGTADTAVILDTSSDNGFLSNIVKKQNFDSSMSPSENNNNDEMENEIENENSGRKNKFDHLESGSRVRGSLLPKGVTFSFTSSMSSSSADNVLASPSTGNVPRDLKRDREHSSSISSSSSSSFLSRTVPSAKCSTSFSHQSLFCESPSRPSGLIGNGRESAGPSSFTPFSFSSPSSNSLIII